MVSVVAVLVGALLAAIAARWSGRFGRPIDHADGEDGRIEAIQRLLPQTQCGQCGVDGCRPYAQALARGEADIDRCPPGGDAGARALAKLLARPARPVDPARGLHKLPQVAWVREADCIGCTKCIQACPVDAIVGASKRMHTVIADLCTGCELCLPPCPVDCIELRPAPAAPVQSRSTR